MATTPETSVVITCYNYGHYLVPCINSVATQTCSDFEIIVIDDGSTDNTAEVMRRYEGAANIRYIRQHNQGQARAKNHGIELARGRYIAFLDADDMWYPQKLEKQIALFSDNAVGVVYSKMRGIDPQGDELELPLATGRYLSPRRGKVTEFLFMDNFVPFSSSIVRKACLSRCGTFDESLKMGIDWDLWLRISTAYGFDFVNEPLLLYRMGHSGQMSKNIEERHRCADRIMDTFLQRFPGAISRQTLKNARYYTECNRGRYYSGVDLRRALRHFGNALKLHPLEKYAYIGVLKMLLRSVRTAHTAG